jgi:hypothetical protein
LRLESFRPLDKDGRLSMEEAEGLLNKVVL